MRTDPERLERVPVDRTAGRSSVLMNQTVPYLAGASNEQLNFEAGENVLLKLEPTARFTSFLVTGPDQKTKPRLVPSPSNEFLEIVAPPDLGPLDGQGDRRPTIATTTLGFSVNAPRGESQFDAAARSRTSTPSSARTATLAEDVRRSQEDRDDRAVWVRDLSLADVPDPDRGDAGEFPGQHVLQGSPRRPARPQAADG